MTIKLNLIFILVSAIASNALAGSATWNPNPTSNVWNTAANWTPATVPNGPTDTATFAVSNKRNVNISSATEVEGMVFNAGANAFKFTAGNEINLTMSGSGITNNSGVSQTFAPAVGTTIFFTNSATAGEQTVFALGDVGCVADFSGSSNAGSGSFTTLAGSTGLSGGVSFTETASAANGIFVNNGGNSSGHAGGYTVFRDSASAGNGTFTNKSRAVADAYTGGVIYLYDESTASDGTFTNEGNGRVLTSDYGDIFLADTATAGNGLFTNQGGAASGQFGGNVNFTGASTGGTATIICNGGQAAGAGGGIVQFTNIADAEEATLIANGGSNGGDGGKIKFLAISKGSNAKIEVFGNGNLDLTPTTGGSFSKAIGSLEGDGYVILGGNTFSVGANNLNTKFSGIIQADGTLSKDGLGSLILTGASTYTGLTNVNGGMLIVNNLTGSGTGTSTVSVSTGTLAGKGTIAGSVVVNPGGILWPGSGPRKPGILTMQSTLFFYDSSTFAFAVNTRTGVANGVTANGVTLNKAQLATSATGRASLPVGTEFTVINNTARTTIVGTFINLPDGGTITVGNNTFQANYEGGDGNDLTLTVVP